MEEFQRFEVTFFNLSPCAAQRYRGSAHRARGLVLQKNPMCFFFNPSLRRCRSSVSPLYCCATQGRRGEYSQRTEKIKRPFKATHLILSLCIATIGIGGVPVGRRGWNKTCKNFNDKIRASVVLYLEINNYSDSRRYDDALRVDSTVKSWVLAGFIIELLVVAFYVFWCFIIRLKECQIRTKWFCNYVIKEVVLSWFLFLGYGKVLLLCDGIIFVYYQYVMKMSINI